MTYTWEANYCEGGHLFEEEGSGGWTAEEDAYLSAEKELREFMGGMPDAVTSIVLCQEERGTDAL